MKNPIWLLISVVLAAALASCTTSQRCGPIRLADYKIPIRVACMGDSITYGHLLEDREHDSYPAQLAALLGDKWEVRNFGVNGATALRKGTRPFNEQPAFAEALSFKPDVVVIQLGTNDTNAKSWPAHKEEFVSDYLGLIRNLQALETRPRIFLCRPVPLFRDRGKVYDTDKILTDEVIPKINEIARRKHLPLIDLYSELETETKLFPDGVHPNSEGAHLMAEKIHRALTGRTGG